MRGGRRGRARLHRAGDRVRARPAAHRGPGRARAVGARGRRRGARERSSPRSSGPGTTSSPTRSSPASARRTPPGCSTRYPDGVPRGLPGGLRRRARRVADLRHARGARRPTATSTLQPLRAAGRRAGERRLQALPRGGDDLAGRGAAGAAAAWASRWSTSGRSTVAPRRAGRVLASSTSACGAAEAGALGASSRSTRFEERVPRLWRGARRGRRVQRAGAAAGLTGAQAAVLRAYARYLRQTGSAFSQEYIEQALAGQPEDRQPAGRSCSMRGSTRTCDGEPRARGRDELRARITRALDDVASLDQDRILRSFLDLIRATLRTNHFQADADGGREPLRRFKLDPAHIRELPEPRPKFEIWVCSPRVEGVHLRFGAVARGGLRWSDRREDFRTEVLGLVKAQAVKNAVIVPVGAKGGFVAKQLPDPARRPRGLAGRGHRRYREFIACAARPHRQPRGRRGRAAGAASSATTATTPTWWSPPTRAPRRSPTSPTASPPGTASGSATPSPPAGRRATTTRRWASRPAAPGSRSERTSASSGRHPTHDFTAVGIGDMSGDVFGNGMLLSRAPAPRGRLRPPAHLPGPGPGPGGLVRRAPAAVRAAALVVGRLRRRADLRGRRGVPARRRSRSRSPPQVRRGARARATASRR